MTGQRVMLTRHMFCELTTGSRGTVVGIEPTGHWRVRFDNHPTDCLINPRHLICVY